MNEIILEILLTIKGITAASGIVAVDQELKIISDDSHYLYSYNMTNAELSKTLLIPGGISEAIPKAQKSDFESIAEVDGYLYIFGSGSSANRNKLVKQEIASGATETVDMTSAYQTMQSDFSIAAEDFNIEGAAYVDDEIWLFNRGNGPAQKNGIIMLDKQSLAPQLFAEVALPTINGVPSGFTDAVCVGAYIYFLAAAEDVASTYLDGEVKGSLIGRMNTKDLKVEFTRNISSSHKFEGLTLFQQSDNTISFLLCEDPDDDSDEATIYKLTIPI